MCHSRCSILASQFQSPHEGTRRFQLSRQGFTFLELMAAVTILLVLASMGVTAVRVRITREREAELRRDLREMREAIDRYKRLSDGAFLRAGEADAHGYPPDLESLVEGVPTRVNPNVKYKVLRRIPVDPMTGSKDWGLRSMQDDLDARSWGGQNVFDVYSKSTGTALDGTMYADW